MKALSTEDNCNRMRDGELPNEPLSVPVQYSAGSIPSLEKRAEKGLDTLRSDKTLAGGFLLLGHALDEEGRKNYPESILTELYEDNPVNYLVNTGIQMEEYLLPESIQKLNPWKKAFTTSFERVVWTIINANLKVSHF